MPQGVVPFECPNGLALCVDKHNAAKLNKYLARVQRYMDDAYKACGPSEEIK